jgi:hypothetical protein
MPLDNAYFKEPLEYITGSVQSVTTKDSERGFGKQIVVEFLPIGETVNRLIFFNADKAMNRRSGWQQWIRSFKSIGVNLTGPNDLEGKFFTFQLIMQNFQIEGKDVTKDFWKPVRAHATEDDAQAASIEYAEKASEAAATGPEAAESEAQPVVAPAQPQFTKDFLNSALTIYKGVGQNVDTFMVVVKQTYPGLDYDALLAAVKAMG